MKIAIITGITGQDGSYLTELLIEKDYIVYGIIRRSSSFNTERIEHVYNNKNLRLRYGDLIDINTIRSVFRELEEIQFDILEIYNLAAQSHVKVSFDMPIYTGQVDAIGVANILECVRLFKYKDKIRFYQASTSELYGDVLETPQNEKTPFNPQSPYAIAKLYAFWITKNYRNAYNIYGCNGILFNHESPRRGIPFVTRKITYSIAKILKGEMDYIQLGNLDARRDWGHAKDYVKAMWLMLQQTKPNDYVISSDKTTSVREFVEKCFKYVNIDIIWEGNGSSEIGKNKKDGRILVKVNHKYYRPTEVNILLGDSNLARKELNWNPEYSLDSLIKEMMDHDLSI